MRQHPARFWQLALLSLLALMLESSQAAAQSAAAANEARVPLDSKGVSDQCPSSDLEHGWARLLKEGDTNQLENLLVDDFVRVDADGHRQERAAYIADLASRRIRIESCTVECLETRSQSDFAVVSATVGVVGVCGDHDLSGFYQVTDTFVRRNEKWQAFSRSETKIASRTDPLWERVGKPDGRPRVVLFVQGSFCPHCMAQLATFAKDLSDQQYSVVVVSGDTEEDLKKFPDLPFKLVADPQHKVFRRFGAFNAVPKHATVAMDGQGILVFRTVGEQPYMDTAVVKRWIDKAAAIAKSQSSRIAN